MPPAKPTASTRTKPAEPAPRTPIADELHAAIDDWIAQDRQGRTLYDLAQVSGVARSMIARFHDGSRSLNLLSIEALAVPLNLRLLRVVDRPKPGRKRS